MLVVHRLHERLHTRALSDLSATHRAVHGERVSVHSSDEGMRVLATFGSLIVGLYNDSLVTGIATLQDDDHLAGLQTGTETHIIRRLETSKNDDDANHL